MTLMNPHYDHLVFCSVSLVLRFFAFNQVHFNIPFSKLLRTDVKHIETAIRLAYCGLVLIGPLGDPS